MLELESKAGCFVQAWEIFLEVIRKAGSAR